VARLGVVVAHFGSSGGSLLGVVVAHWGVELAHLGVTVDH
jgi:hypothetical protein